MHGEDVAYLEKLILDSKSELRNVIEAFETRLLLSQQELKNKVLELEQENECLKSRVEILERNSKKNNIIIHGLQTSTLSSTDSFCQEVSKLLNIKLNPSDINDAFVLGNQGPIKVEFISQQTRKLVFKNVKNLKGKNIYISSDLTQKQLAIQKTLRQYLVRLRQNSTKNCYIKGERLYIGNKPYTVEQLDSEEILEEKKPSSAPSTPQVRQVTSLEGEDCNIERKQANKVDTQNIIIKPLGSTATPKSTSSSNKASKPNNLTKTRTRSTKQL